MKKNILLSTMKEHGDTNIVLAKVINVSPQAVSAKINEKNHEFTKSEIEKIRERYHLTDNQIEDIFFD